MDRQQFSDAIRTAVQTAIMMRRKVTPDQVKELSQQNLTQAEIAKSIGVSRERIRQLCNEHGITCVRKSKSRYVTP